MSENCPKCGIAEHSHAANYQYVTYACGTEACWVGDTHTLVIVGRDCLDFQLQQAERRAAVAERIIDLCDGSHLQLPSWAWYKGGLVEERIGKTDAEVDISTYLAVAREIALAEAEQEATP